MRGYGIAGIARANGVPLAGGTVSVECSPMRRRATVDDAGLFELQMCEVGEYAVDYTSPTGERLRLAAVEVSERQRLELDFPSTSLSARLLLPDGRPAAHVRGVLLGSCPGHFQSDAEGRIELAMIPPGTYSWLFSEISEGCVAPRSFLELRQPEVVEYRFHGLRKLELFLPEKPLGAIEQVAWIDETGASAPLLNNPSTDEADRIVQVEWPIEGRRGMVWAGSHCAYFEVTPGAQRAVVLLARRHDVTFYIQDRQGDPLPPALLRIFFAVPEGSGAPIRASGVPDNGIEPVALPPGDYRAEYTFARGARVVREFTVSPESTRRIEVRESGE